MNEIKPQQFWIQNPYNEISTATKVPAYDPEVNPQITEEIHVQEVTPCANCERLEEANTSLQFLEKSQYDEIKRLQKQLEMCKEVVGNFNKKYSPGENWYPEFVDLLAKLEKE